MQLVILNFSSFVGRLSSGFAAHVIGAPITITFSSVCCAAVILGMIGVKTVSSVVLVAIFFGFFAGTCKLVYLEALDEDADKETDIAMNAPVLAVLADDFGEIGYVHLIFVMHSYMVSRRS